MITLDLLSFFLLAVTSCFLTMDSVRKRKRIDLTLVIDFVSMRVIVVLCLMSCLTSVVSSELAPFIINVA